MSATISYEQAMLDRLNELKAKRLAAKPIAEKVKAQKLKLPSKRKRKH